MVTDILVVLLILIGLGTIIYWVIEFCVLFINELRSSKNKEEEKKYAVMRKFEEIVVNYPSAELCTYPEYRGKPYFSIKYEENGEHFIGFGTYKPEVLSRFLREYFINVEEDTKNCKEDKDNGNT